MLTKDRWKFIERHLQTIETKFDETIPVVKQIRIHIEYIRDDITYQLANKDNDGNSASRFSYRSFPTEVFDELLNEIDFAISPNQSTRNNLNNNYKNNSSNIKNNNNGTRSNTNNSNTKPTSASTKWDDKPSNIIVYKPFEETIYYQDYRFQNFIFYQFCQKSNLDDESFPEIKANSKKITKYNKIEYHSEIDGLFDEFHFIATGRKYHVNRKGGSRQVSGRNVFANMSQNQNKSNDIGSMRHRDSSADYSPGFSYHRGSIGMPPNQMRMKQTMSNSSASTTFSSIDAATNNNESMFTIVEPQAKTDVSWAVATSVLTQEDIIFLSHWFNYARLQTNLRQYVRLPLIELNKRDLISLKRDEMCRLPDYGQMSKLFPKAKKIMEYWSEHDTFTHSFENYYV